MKFLQNFHVEKKSRMFPEKKSSQSKFCVGLGYSYMPNVRSDHMQFEKVCDTPVLVDAIWFSRKMILFVNTVQALIIFAKSFILNVSQGSQTSVLLLHSIYLHFNVLYHKFLLFLKMTFFL